MGKIRSVADQLPAAHEAPNWFAFRTGFRREKQVAKRLTARGIEHYLPLRQVVRHYKSKTTTSEQPLFNGYVFARITYAAYATVLSDPDVYEIVRFDGEVGRVADAEIAFLRVVLGDASEQLHTRVHEGLVDGDPVVITGGTLAGTRGIVVGGRENNSFVVELAGLGIGIAMSIDARYIAPDPQTARALT